MHHALPETFVQYLTSTFNKSCPEGKLAKIANRIHSVINYKKILKINRIVNSYRIHDFSLKKQTISNRITYEFCENKIKPFSKKRKSLLNLDIAKDGENLLY